MIKAVLHLNLKKKWYDMIASNEKKSEYREVKPYWERVFTPQGIKIKTKLYKASEVAVCFSNGYSKQREQMMLNLDSVFIIDGSDCVEEWGAEPDKKYFVLTFKGETRRDEYCLD